jgi:hypothetical protein
MKHLSPAEFLSERDRDLLARQFNFIGDPETIPGLVERLPPNSKLFRIEHKYNVTPPGGAKKGKRPRIRCAHCHAPLHWKGWCIQLDDGSLALIGIDCGEKQFGLDFNSSANDFDFSHNRQTAIQRVIEIREALPAALQEIRGLLKDPAIRAFDAYQEQLHAIRRQNPHLITVLAATLMEGQGQLAARLCIRDKAAEEDRARRAQPELFLAHESAINKNKGAGVVKACANRIKKWMEYQEPLFKTEFRPMGRVLGARIVTERKNALSLLKEIVASFDDAAKEFMGQTSDYWNPKQLGKSIDALRKCFEKANDLHELLAHLLEFTSPTNLARIAAWSSAEINSDDPRVNAALTSEGRTIFLQDAGLRLELPSDYRIRPLPELDKLQALVGIRGSATS